MRRHAGNFCQCPEGGQRGPCPAQSVSGGAAGEAAEEGQDFHAADSGPGRGHGGGSVSWHRGGQGRPCWRSRVGHHW